MTTDEGAGGDEATLKISLLSGARNKNHSVFGHWQNPLLSLMLTRQEELDQELIQPL